MNTIAIVVAVVIAVFIPVVMAEMSSPFFSVPIFPFRSLPTEQSPRIVLNGDQRLYRADTRINNMTPAPVLNYAVRMFFRMLSPPVLLLSQGGQSKESKDAKHTHPHTHCGNNFSQDASPIDSVQRLADGRPTGGNVIKHLARL